MSQLVATKRPLAFSRTLSTLNCCVLGACWGTTCEWMLFANCVVAHRLIKTHGQHTQLGGQVHVSTRGKHHFFPNGQSSI